MDEEAMLILSFTEERKDVLTELLGILSFDSILSVCSSSSSSEKTHSSISFSNFY